MVWCINRQQPTWLNFCGEIVNRWWLFVIASPLVLSATAITVANSSELRIGPRDKLDALRSQAEQIYPFIVSFSKVDKVAAESVRKDLSFTVREKFNLIDAIALNLKVARAFELSEMAGIEQVWYLHPDVAPLYINTIKALDYNVKTLPLPVIVNLSIGPEPKYWTKDYNDDPMLRTLSAASDAGLIPVVAIGNNTEAEQLPGWVSPWCRSAAVICVGAWDVARKRVADFSARGAPDTQTSWPTVVADGIDIIGPYPTGLAKSIDRKMRDESNAAFRMRVKREDWDIYTLESGTSQATAMVSAAAGQVLFFLREMIRRRNPTADGKMFSLTSVGKPSKAKQRIPRLTGKANELSDGRVEYEYSLDTPSRMVKQILMDTSIDLDAEAYEAGAGLVDPDYIKQQFGEYGPAPIKVFPTKVLEH
jgi:hypothetical protein